MWIATGSCPYRTRCNFYLYRLLVVALGFLILGLFGLGAFIHDQAVASGRELSEGDVRLLANSDKTQVSTVDIFKWPKTKVRTIVKNYPIPCH